TGLFEIVRTAFKRSLTRFSMKHPWFDGSSDVMRYTQATLKSGLHVGEGCRLTPSLCSGDEQCCSGRCLCRKWLLMGEERCLRKCF
ncbi:unnamed protein product, partial [Didymodactylos carnosus]